MNNFNKKDIIQLIITCVLVIVLIPLIVSSRKSPKNKNGVPAPISQGSPGIPSDRNLPQLYDRLLEETRNMTVARDPFVPVKVESPEGSKRKIFRVSGIFVEGETMVAIVNDTIVRVGDRIDGFTVTDIKNNGVILRDDASEIQLSIE